MTNLYFNQHLDLDLAEQQAVCVFGSCAVIMSDQVIDYYRYTVLLMKIASYQAMMLQHVIVCDEPAERIRVSGRVNFPSTEYPRTIESLQKNDNQIWPYKRGISSWGMQ